MKLYFLFITFFLGTLIMSVSAQTPKQKVAVYVTGDAENGYKKVISSKLVTGITHSDGYTAIERTADFLAELNKEHDYGMSGAVRDSQIARLGQQFGVRYVLVADISEVFESMFISARMIDVETARIINSTEASGVVSNLESLSQLAGSIVSEIIGAYAVSGTVQQRSVSTFDDLFCLNPPGYWGYNKTVPSGYHVATYDEIKDIIRNYQMIGKELYFPIYVDVKSFRDIMKQYYSIDFYHFRNDKYEKTLHCDRSYEQNRVTCWIFENESNISELSLQHIEDDTYTQVWSARNTPGDKDHYKLVSSGLENMTTPKPNISPGYVYLVKDK